LSAVSVRLFSLAITRSSFSICSTAAMRSTPAVNQSIHIHWREIHLPDANTAMQGPHMPPFAFAFLVGALGRGSSIECLPRRLSAASERVYPTPQTPPAARETCGPCFADDRVQSYLCV